MTGVEPVTWDELQAIHELSQKGDPAHDGSSCWCCCMDCEDLEWEWEGSE